MTTTTDGNDPPEPGAVVGLTGLQADPPERVPIRVRSSSATLSAWHRSITSDQGRGAIVLVEPRPGESYYRGEGVLLGWTQERLATLYAALLPEEEESAPGP